MNFVDSFCKGILRHLLVENPPGPDSARMTPTIEVRDTKSRLSISLH